MMYSMKEACIQTGMSYETLKFYCKEGLVPNVKTRQPQLPRFRRPRHQMDPEPRLPEALRHDAGGNERISRLLPQATHPPFRSVKEIRGKKEALLASMEKLQKAIDYIDWKQNFYDDVLSGKIEYHSNLISDEEIAQKAQ